MKKDTQIQDDYNKEQEAIFRAKRQKEADMILNIVKILSGQSVSDAQSILRRCQERIQAESIVK